MFEALEQINERPEPFEVYTAHDLWTDQHTSARMLAFHLDEDADVASRNAAFIDRSVEWIVERFGVGRGTAVADFGCGPGLYAARLARKDARVTGIDFSARSITHAREAAAAEGLDVRYVHQDYLAFDTGERYDLILMIMCDFCALGPPQRADLLTRFHRFLKPAGSVLLDVYSMAAFDRREETATYAADLLDGFWAPGTYYGFLNTFKYEDDAVAVDKYTIVEPGRTRTVYNWLQHFSPERLERGFSACGLRVDEVYADVAGTPFDAGSGEFAVVAGKG